MRCLIILCLLIQALITVQNTQSDPPKSETLSLWNFGQVSRCVLNYSPLVYNRYGCWCGFGGKHKPVDEIDSCCMNHDKCYDSTISSKVCPNLKTVYLQNYNFKCINGTAICDEHNTPCQSALCACDVAVAKCWSQYPRPQKKKKCPCEVEMTNDMLKHFHR